jgi:glyoxylase-like metal-dependent hydrolase (beta-lactamase superfamily II)
MRQPIKAAQGTDELRSQRTGGWKAWLYIAVNTIGVSLPGQATCRRCHDFLRPEFSAKTRKTAPEAGALPFQLWGSSLPLAGSVPLAPAESTATVPAMQLEDHLGDIVRKAAQAAGVSTAAAAKAAGLRTGEFAALVESGQSARPLNIATLAAALGVDARKLDGIARGWRPPPQDLGRWRELRIITTTRDGNSVNAFLLWDAASRTAALFDTGWDAEPVLRIIVAEHLQLQHICITHAHDDHIAALPSLRQAHPGALCHAGAQAPRLSARTAVPLQLGGLHITSRETPGHARDGMIYVVEGWPDDAPPVATIGDTIFAGSVARGFVSWGILKQKIRECIFTLPAETLLCPGHGPLTTVAEEQANNPFF